MTCKDCICSEVCYYKAFNDERILKKRRDDVEKICKSFVHREKIATDNNVGCKWIPVTERLPEYGEIVLAFGKRHATSGQFRGTGSNPTWWHWKGNMVKEVSHWMPLPEPPKGE